MKTLIISIALSLACFNLSAGNKQLAKKSPRPIENQVLEFDFNGFCNYLENGNPDKLEGVYSSKDDRYMIAIVKNETDKHDYIGVVLNADNPFWTKGEVKFNLVKDSAFQVQGFYYDSKGNAFPVGFDLSASEAIHKIDKGILQTKRADWISLL